MIIPETAAGVGTPEPPKPGLGTLRVSGQPRLLPDAGQAGPERLSDHLRTLGRLPETGGLIDALTRSGLRGRGGAGFPVGRKWASVAAAGDRPAVLVNGAEGEPLSHKDQVLLTTRPHLVLDGASSPHALFSRETS